MAMSKAHHKLGISTDKENRQKDDFYATPPHVTLALLDVEEFKGEILEPACGQGHISEVLAAFGDYSVISEDLVYRGYGEGEKDFLKTPIIYRCDNIITNPPFKFANAFIKKALTVTRNKIALLLPLSYLAGQKRFKEIFKDNPPSRVWVFSNRVNMLRDAIAVKNNSMINYAWFIWDKQSSDISKIGWIHA